MTVEKAGESYLDAGMSALILLAARRHEADCISTRTLYRAPNERRAWLPSSVIVIASLELVLPPQQRSLLARRAGHDAT